MEKKSVGDSGSNACEAKRNSPIPKLFLNPARFLSFLTTLFLRSYLDGSLPQKRRLCHPQSLVRARVDTAVDGLQ